MQKTEQLNRPLSHESCRSGRSVTCNAVVKWRAKVTVTFTMRNGGKAAMSMLFLRLDQAREFLRAALTLREKLVSRYFLLNGLAPMELSLSRIEYLDPYECTLFLPRRHWKKNCIAHIDRDTVKLQIIYSGDRAEGPLIRARGEKQPHRTTMNVIVKRIAARTNIPRRDLISPLVLKRTFAREWLKWTATPEQPGGNLGSLQKQLSHKHLWSTARYLRFTMDDVKPDHRRMVDRVVPQNEKEEIMKK